MAHVESHESEHHHFGPGTQLFSVSLIDLGVLALVFLVIAWAVGGTAYFENLGGRELFWALIGAIAVGFGLKIWDHFGK